MITLRNGRLVIDVPRPDWGPRSPIDAALDAADRQHVAAYRSILAAPCEPPAGLAGDGVVYALYEANERAHVATAIALRILREVGWRGRVQLWHVGCHPQLPGLDVELIDARGVLQRVGGDPREISGWPIKSFALCHSGLARVQWLDWDAYAAADPAPLFAALQRHCMVYWASESFWPYNRAIHQAVYGGGHDDDGRPGHGIQGGSFLLDCTSSAGWRLLTLQRYCDSHAAWWYPRNRNSDEEGWRLGIAATACNALWARPMPWQHPAWLNYHAGTPYVVHRCSGKLWPDCAPKWNLALPLERRVQELFRELAGEGYRRAVFAPCRQALAPRGGRTWKQLALRRQRQQQIASAR